MSATSPIHEVRTTMGPFPQDSQSTAPGETPERAGAAAQSGIDGTGSPAPAYASSNSSSQHPDLLARVVHGAHATIDRLAESVSSAGESLNTGAGHVRDVGDEWAESLRITVREHPLAAVAAAVALGMLISRLTSHR
jgi:hypothetical protein